MTTTSEDGTAAENAEPIEDPHASKIAADDPRLRIRANSGRTLKKGPAVVVASVLGGGLVATLVVTLAPAPKGSEKRSETSTGQAAAPVVPEAIRNEPAHAAREYRSAPLRSDASSDSRVQGSYAVRDVTAEQAARARSAGILFETPGPTPSPLPPALHRFRQGARRRMRTAGPRSIRIFRDGRTPSWTSKAPARPRTTCRRACSTLGVPMKSKQAPSCPPS